MPSSPPPLSVAEAAKEKDVAARTIRHAILRGDLPAHKLGGQTGAYVINRRDLDKWIAKREAKAEASA